MKNNGFGMCTNAIYDNVLGGKKSDICKSRGFKESTNLRDVMSVEELVATSMSELVASKRIRSNNAQGNTRCRIECDLASKSVTALSN